MNSIRRNLTRTLVFAILVLAAAGWGAVYLSARFAVIDQFDVALAAKAQAIETLTKAMPGGAEVGFTDRYFRGFDNHRPEDFFEIWDDEGHSLARSESLGDAHLTERAGLTSRAKFYTMPIPNGEAGRAMGLTFVPKPIKGPTPALPIFHLVVVSDRDHLDDNLELLASLAAGCGVALIGVTLLLIPRVLRSGLEPLHDLGEKAAAIDSSSLASRFPIDDLPVELHPIAVRLNDLLARIEHSFERERRFSADLAHELRTPLAELRSTAECAIKWPESRTGRVDKETLAIALQMEGMVGHMLALARSEQGQLKAGREPIRLGELVQQRWERIEPKARDRGFSTEVERVAPNALSLGTPLPFSETASPIGDLVLVRSIVDNLLENAVEYAAPGGLIQVFVSETALTVSNTVADFRAEDVGRLFQRFWRKESARSGGQHVGLGLTLSLAFAQAMGWTLSATLVEPDRLEMKLEAPRPDQRSSFANSPATSSALSGK
jgi:two-component system sensor histidine kinase QseC